MAAEVAWSLAWMAAVWLCDFFLVDQLHSLASVLLLLITGELQSLFSSLSCAWWCRAEMPLMRRFGAFFLRTICLTVVVVGTWIWCNSLIPCIFSSVILLLAIRREFAAGMFDFLLKPDAKSRRPRD